MRDETPRGGVSRSSSGGAQVGLMEPFITADRRVAKKGAAPIIEGFLRILDSLWSRTSRHLRLINNATATRMRYHYRDVARYMNSQPFTRENEDR
jgi:hypothetical protein